MHDQNSKDMVLLKMSSLTSLDVSLADDDTNGDNISRRTVLRSNTAVEYILDHWTVATDSRGSDESREGSLFDSVDESSNEYSLSFGSDHRSLKENTSFLDPRKDFPEAATSLSQNFAGRLPPKGKLPRYLQWREIPGTSGLALNRLMDLLCISQYCR